MLSILLFKDSGIKVEKGTVEKMATMTEIKKAPYDLLVLDIETIPGATGTGTKSAPEHLIITKEWVKGECEKALEGQDIGQMPSNFYTFRDYVLKDYPDKCCMALLYYKFTNKGGSIKEKLLAVNW